MSYKKQKLKLLCTGPELSVMLLYELVSLSHQTSALIDQVELAQFSCCQVFVHDVVPNLVDVAHVLTAGNIGSRLKMGAV